MSDLQKSTVLRVGSLANTALGFTLCCICHLTPPLVLYFPYITRNGALTYTCSTKHYCYIKQWLLLQEKRLHLKLRKVQFSILDEIHTCTYVHKTMCLIFGPIIQDMVLLLTCVFTNVARLVMNSSHNVICVYCILPHDKYGTSIQHHYCKVALCILSLVLLLLQMRYSYSTCIVTC